GPVLVARSAPACSEGTHRRSGHTRRQPTWTESGRSPPGGARRRPSRAGRSEDPADGVEQVLCHAVRRDGERRPTVFPLAESVAREDERGAGARAVAGEDVRGLVADDPRAAEVDVEVVRGPDEEPGLGLPAVALGPEGRRGCPRVVHSDVEPVEG